MSRLEGCSTPKHARISRPFEAAVRPGRHEPDSKREDAEHDTPNAQTPNAKTPRCATIAHPPSVATTPSPWAWRPRSPPVTSERTAATPSRSSSPPHWPNSMPLPTPRPTPARKPCPHHRNHRGRDPRAGDAGNRYPDARLAQSTTWQCSTTTPNDRSIWAAKNASRPPTNESSATPATAAVPCPNCVETWLPQRSSPRSRLGQTRRPNRRRQTVSSRCGCDHCVASSGELRHHQSPTAVDSGWTDGSGPPEINHAHHPDELLRGDPDPPSDES